MRAALPARRRCRDRGAQDWPRETSPALRIHPANEHVLRYFSPQIEWELIALSEHWRQELKVVFRKHGPAA